MTCQHQRLGNSHAPCGLLALAGVADASGFERQVLQKPVKDSPFV